MEEDKTIHCIECKEKIKEDALLCVHCSSYQKNWKNVLKYWASVIVIFVVIGSFVLWSITMWPNVRKILLWNDEVRIVGLNSLGSTTVANFGDGSVYLSHIVILYPNIDVKYKQKVKRIEFLELIRPGDFIKKETNNENYGKVKFFPSQDYDIQGRNNLIEKAVREKNCYRILFFIDKDPFYMDIKKQQRDPVSVDSRGYISYYSPKKEKLQFENINIVAVVVKKDKYLCEENSVN